MHIKLNKFRLILAITKKGKCGKNGAESAHMTPSEKIMRCSRMFRMKNIGILHYSCVCKGVYAKAC